MLSLVKSDEDVEIGEIGTNFCLLCKSWNKISILSIVFKINMWNCRASTFFTQISSDN